ncbi:MAG: DNA repair protein RadC [Alphaproteobacteria bacterium]|nr:DNA repair protein RadC [Alphaproteobacteria bacterium]
MTAEKPDYLGHRQRLRQRFWADEGKSMPDYELLELLLMTYIPRKDVKPIAKKLLQKFGSLAGLQDASPDELMTVDGIKESTVTNLKIMKAINLRTTWRILESGDKTVIDSQDRLDDYCRTAMGNLDIEECRIFFLNSKLNIIGEEIVQRGTISQVAIHPREVIKLVLKKNAESIILAHNHPSGDVTPSRSDIAMTKQLKEALDSINVRLLDHIIISKNQIYSFNKHHIF